MYSAAADLKKKRHFSTPHDVMVTCKKKKKFFFSALQNCTLNEPQLDREKQPVAELLINSTRTNTKKKKNQRKKKGLHTGIETDKKNLAL